MEESFWIWIVFVLWLLFGVGVFVLLWSREFWFCIMVVEIDISYFSFIVFIMVFFLVLYFVCFFFVVGMSFEVLFCIVLCWGFIVI